VLISGLSNNQFLLVWVCLVMVTVAMVPSFINSTFGLCISHWLVFSTFVDVLEFEAPHPCAYWRSQWWSIPLTLPYGGETLSDTLPVNL
jgi:hypothetical protein